MRPFSFIAVALTAVSTAAIADVKLNPLFTPGAVLQQGKAVPVWGTARDGEKVTVEFAGQKKSTKASNGRWMVRLRKMKASAEPRTLTARGDNTVTVPDILVGEVWICSGQSNMQWAVGQSAESETTISSARDSGVRLFTVPRQATGAPLAEVKASWQQLSPDTVKNFSAVGYFFGRALRAARKVPIGLISTNYGGTPAEAWTRRAVVEQGFPSIITSQRLASMPMTNPNAAGGLYNAMIAPLIPYAIRGAIWYQGESNAGRAWEYRTLFPAMIRNWRDDWGQGDFPFLFVQLAPFMAIEPTPKESAWAELREAQLLTLEASKNTGMAVITDLGDEKDIHPKRKREVGERLALAARKIAYGEDIPYRGPSFRSMTVRGNKAIIDFNYADGGLEANGLLKGFAIAGEDGKWVKADAVILRKSVIVSSPAVKRPVAVRYGWANYPVVNLANGAGLPASPFRTDSYPVTTQPK